MHFWEILITVDQSAFAACAANVGLDLSRSVGAEIALVYVIDPSLDV